MAIYLKRIYEEYCSEDGFRILVDRIWPRGVSKQQAHIDLWLKEIAPTTELRKWFNHDLSKYETFKQKYQVELLNGEQQQELARLQQLVAENETVTLLYGAKSKEYNQARVLKEMIEKTNPT